MKEKESDNILLRAFKNRGIFSGNYVHGLWCLVKLQKANSEFIVKALLYNASLGVDSREILNDVETSDGAWLMLAKIEKGREGFCIVSVRAKLACWEQIDDANALAKQEVLNRGDVVEQREALRRDAQSMILHYTFPGWELNDIIMKIGFDVFNRISKGLPKMLSQLPLDSLKNLVAILKELSHPSKRLAEFWDYENCRIPTEGEAKVPPEKACGNIKAYIKSKFEIDEKFVTIYAYADLSKIGGKVQKALEDTGVVVIDTPKVTNQKDVADKAIMFALGMYAILYPSSMMLITGDVDFVYALKTLHNMGHKVILAIPSGVWVRYAMTDASDYVLYWPNLVRGEDQPALRLEIKKDTMKVHEKRPSIVGVPVESQLQLLSLEDVKPVQSRDLKGLKRELLTLRKDSRGSRTLLALLLNIGKFYAPADVLDYGVPTQVDLLKKLNHMISVKDHVVTLNMKELKSE